MVVVAGAAETGTAGQETSTVGDSDGERPPFRIRGVGGEVEEALRPGASPGQQEKEEGVQGEARRAQPSPKVRIEQELICVSESGTCFRLGQRSCPRELCCW